MIPMTVGEICAVVGGVCHEVDVATWVTDVVVDSREAAPGAMFVAIAGERADGHAFASQARKSGACVTLSARVIDGPCLVVDDPVHALGRLAHWVRTHRLTCTVVAITGSSGKTSTKDLVAQVLARSGRTVAAAGSFNTEVGVPLTILRADETTEYLVLEMGMRGEGHIRYLCEIATPSVGVLINIGSAHLGMLGSVGAIARAKGEILEGLPTDGVAIVNGDDAAVMEQASRTAATVMTFGVGPSCDVRATDLRLDDRACPAFTLHHGDRAVPVALLLRGEHSAHNALAAAAVGVTLKVPIESIAAALGASMPQSKWRMEVRESEEGWIIVNDAYNANPDSMRAALEVLATMSANHRSWAVLGEMKELGETAEAEHEAIGRLVCDLGITRLVGIGAGAHPMERACQAEGSAITEATWVATPDEAVTLLRSELNPGDVVLVKASRSVGLERLAAALMSKGQL